jgi:hypothetical protein
MEAPAPPPIFKKSLRLIFIIYPNPIGIMEYWNNGMMGPKK